MNSREEKKKKKRKGKKNIPHETWAVGAISPCSSSPCSKASISAVVPHLNELSQLLVSTA